MTDHTLKQVLCFSAITNDQPVEVLHRLRITDSVHELYRKIWIAKKLSVGTGSTATKGFPVGDWRVCHLYTHHSANTAFMQFKQLHPSQHRPKSTPFGSLKQWTSVAACALLRLDDAIAGFEADLAADLRKAGLPPVILIPHGNMVVTAVAPLEWCTCASDNAVLCSVCEGLSVTPVSLQIASRTLWITLGKYAAILEG